MTTIYAVSSGSYSDYRVNALFSTKAKAKAFMAAVKESDYNDVEEYELDPPDAQHISDGLTVWRVVMLRDGTTERAEATGNDLYSLDLAGTEEIWRRTKAPAYRGSNVQDAIVVNAWATNKKHAVKIANEKRTQWIAEGRWRE